MNFKRIAHNLSEEEINNRKQALAELLSADIDEINTYSYGTDTYYKIDDKEYLIYNEDEAYEAAIESVKNLIDDVGINCINGYENFIDEYYFEEMQRDDNKIYCENILGEDDHVYGNRLVKECYDNNIINDDDFASTGDEDGDVDIDYRECFVDTDNLIEDYTEYLCNQETPLQHMLNIYSPKELCKYHPESVDKDALAEYVVDTDGKGHCLSGYDGKELESNGYYIYRIN